MNLLIALINALLHITDFIYNWFYLQLISFTTDFTYNWFYLQLILLITVEAK
jgi:hypothetical protein